MAEWMAQLLHSARLTLMLRKRRNSTPTPPGLAPHDDDMMLNREGIRNPGLKWSRLISQFPKNAFKFVIWL